MSGRGGKAIQKKRSSKAQRSGLVMPVSRFIRHMKAGNYSKRLSNTSGVYIAAVVEYLVAEVLELAGKASADNNKKRITPRHIQLAIRNDEELDRLLRGVQISQGGVIPQIHPVLFKKRSEWNRYDTAIGPTSEAEIGSAAKKEKSASGSPKKEKTKEKTQR